MLWGQKCDCLWPGRPLPDTPNTACTHKSTHNYHDNNNHYTKLIHMYMYIVNTCIYMCIYHTNLSLVSAVKEFWKLCKNESIWILCTDTGLLGLITDRGKDLCCAIKRAYQLSKRWTHRQYIFILNIHVDNWDWQWYTCMWISNVTSLW